MKKTKQKGFTLIELLVVVLIIGILSAAAWPQYQVAVGKARFVKIQSWVEQLNDAEEMYFQEHGTYTDNFRDLKDFRVPGWVIEDKGGQEGVYLTKYNDSTLPANKRKIQFRLSLEALFAEKGRAIIGTAFKGSTYWGPWTNRYVLFTPHGGWRKSVRECRANVDEGTVVGKHKTNRWNVNNRVCDGVGGIRCKYKDANGNIFIMATVVNKPGSRPKDICESYIAEGEEGQAAFETDLNSYYKGKKWYQSNVAGN